MAKYETKFLTAMSSNNSLSADYYKNYKPKSNLNFSILQIQTIIDCNSAETIHSFTGLSSSGKTSVLIDFIRGLSNSKSIKMLIVNKSKSAL